MHYYQFNIGDYTSHTRGLSLLEDLAYRRLIDEYFLTERPLNGRSTDVARIIGFAEHVASVEYVLERFFEQIDGSWVHERIEKDIESFRSKSESAAKAGKASAQARRNKGVLTNVEHPINDRSTTVQPTNNQEPLTSNHKPITNNQEPIPKEPIGQNQTPISVDVKKSTKKQPPETSETWSAYSDAYANRYGIQPLRNQQTNSQMAKFCKAVPLAEAPAIAAFYVWHNDMFYVKQSHPVGLLLNSAQKLRTEWATGRQVTTTSARQLDQKQSNYDVVQEAIRLDKLEGKI